jgi:hypothetical protein
MDLLLPPRGTPGERQRPTGRNAGSTCVRHVSVEGILS